MNLRMQTRRRGGASWCLADGTSNGQHTSDRNSESCCHTSPGVLRLLSAKVDSIAHPAVTPSPSSALSPFLFLGEGSPTTIDYRKTETVPTYSKLSNPENPAVIFQSNAR